MAKKISGSVKGIQADTKGNQERQATSGRSRRVAEAGVYDANQFANMMSSMMSDLVTGDMTPAVANAACNAGGKLLKVVEMQLKYANKDGTLKLAGPS